MAPARRTEPDSVSIWLKLSAEDAARMTQVLTRPEFAGWTRAEWCLEMIQTALGYYTRPRPAATADGERAPAAEPALAPGTEREARAEPVAEAEAEVKEPVAEAEAEVKEPVAEAEAEVKELVAEEPGPTQAECSHPADARDYQSGTCAACGAILWD